MGPRKIIAVCTGGVPNKVVPKSLEIGAVGKNGAYELSYGELPNEEILYGLSIFYVDDSGVENKLARKLSRTAKSLDELKNFLDGLKKTVRRMRWPWILREVERDRKF